MSCLRAKCCEQASARYLELSDAEGRCGAVTAQVQQQQRRHTDVRKPRCMRTKCDNAQKIVFHPALPLSERAPYRPVPVRHCARRHYNHKY